TTRTAMCQGRTKPIGGHLTASPGDETHRTCTATDPAARAAQVLPALGGFVNLSRPTVAGCGPRPAVAVPRPPARPTPPGVPAGARVTPAAPAPCASAAASAPPPGPGQPAGAGPTAPGIPAPAARRRRCPAPPTTTWQTRIVRRDAAPPARTGSPRDG